MFHVEHWVHPLFVNYLHANVTGRASATRSLLWPSWPSAVSLAPEAALPPMPDPDAARRPSTVVATPRAAAAKPVAAATVSNSPTTPESDPRAHPSARSP